MPGRLRDRGTLSDKAQGCCTKCCESCCRCALPTKILVISLVALIVATLAAWIFGASLAGPGGPNLVQGKGVSLCGRVNTSFTRSDGGDYTLPISNHNVYAWYLANTGIFVMLMVVGTCVCCGSFVGLCCGDFPKGVKICSIIGWILFILVFIIFTLWVVLGIFLLISYSGSAIANAVCRNLAIYLIVIFFYYVILVVTFVVSCIWKSWSAATAEPKSRPSVESKPKIPISTLV